jgi:hypothetical protein
MPKAAPIKATFASGEVSPTMYGRTDLQQYYNGLEIAENCLVRPYGLIMNRPGSEFIAPVKFPAKDTKLIEFVFNEADAFIIEFGEFYFRFFTLGAAVTETGLSIIAASQANPCVIEITTHGLSVDDEIVITDVLGMTELNGNRYRVKTVVDPNNIELKDLDGVDVDATGFTAYISGGTASKIYEVAHTYTESELFDVHFAQINDVVNLAHGSHKPAELIRMAADDWVLTDVDFIGGPVQDINITPTTITPSAATGAVTLTASTAIFEAGHVGSIWRIRDGYVDITGFTSSTIVTGTVQSGDNLGALSATTEWHEGSWSDVAGYPATITYHERRRFYARTDAQPQTQWASVPFVYDDYTTGPNADDALDLTLNTEKANDIKWMSSGTTLATGTFGGEFITSSGTNGISLTPDNANAVRQTGWGSLNIQPQKIANFVYYVQRASRKIRELFYYWDLDTYKSVDMTILSEHITTSGIINIAYQQNPDTSLYCVRADGEMAVLVREEDQQVKAWTRLVTDGLYKSVASIPSFLGPYDEVWTIVERTINGVTRKYVERFADPVVDDTTRQEDCFYVDAGLTLKVYDNTTGIGLTLSALTGSGITVTAGSAIFEANDVGQRVRAIDTVTGDFVGEVLITGYTSATEVTGDVTSDFDALTYAGNEWGISVTTIGGLGYLEAKTLSILGDGAVQTQQTVASGSVTLERDVFELSIGIPYTATVKTLSVEAGAADGTAQGKKKRIWQLGLRVNRTLGIEVGGTVDNTYLVTLRDPQTPMGTPETLYTGIIPNTRFNGGWVYEAKVVIKQSNPYPMQILGIMPILQTNDK